MRQRFKYRNGEWIPAEQATEPSYEGHYVQDDTMPATWHPITGEMFNSKSAFRRVTKMHGCTEIGNEKIRKKEEPRNIEREKQEFADTLYKKGIWKY